MHKLPCLFLLLVILFFSSSHSASVDSSIDLPKTLAHCQCRCCHRVQRAQVQCDSEPKVVPVPNGGSCDTRLINPHDATACSAALCRVSFPGECLPPSYFTHTCISDRGIIRDWAPLVFVSIMLVAFAYFASIRAAQGPRLDDSQNDSFDAGYKRDPMPEPDPNVLHPLMPQNPVRYDGEKQVEIIDVSPRSLAQRNTHPIPAVSLMASPVRSSSAPLRSSVSPMQRSISPQQDMISPQINAADMRRSGGSPMASADLGRGRGGGEGT